MPQEHGSRSACRHAQREMSHCHAMVSIPTGILDLCSRQSVRAPPGLGRERVGVGEGGQRRAWRTNIASFRKCRRSAVRHRRTRSRSGHRWRSRRSFDGVAGPTARMSKLFQWGLGDPWEIERWNPRLALIDVVPVVADFEQIPLPQIPRPLPTDEQDPSHPQRHAATPLPVLNANQHHAQQADYRRQSTPRTMKMKD
jgi:hypothetical protein